MTLPDRGIPQNGRVSPDGTLLYVADLRAGGGHLVAGSVSVVDFATRKIVATWPIPGAGCPNMGNVSVDGKQLWLSGRYDRVVDVIDTTSSEVVLILGLGLGIVIAPVAAEAPVGSKAPRTTDNEPLQPTGFAGG